MSLTLWQNKGSRLTIKEVDDNFLYLEDQTNQVAQDLNELKLYFDNATNGQILQKQSSGWEQTLVIKDSADTDTLGWDNVDFLKVHKKIRLLGSEQVLQSNTNVNNLIDFDSLGDKLYIGSPNGVTINSYSGGTIGGDVRTTTSGAKIAYYNTSEAYYFGAENGGLSMQLGSDATGDIYYRGSDGFVKRLPIGTNNQFLKVQSGLPHWASGGGGGGVTEFIFTDANGFTGTVTNATTTPTLSLVLQNATTSQSGQLTSTDWNTFNNSWRLGGQTLAANGVLGGTSGNFPVSIFTNNREVARFLSDGNTRVNYLTVQSSIASSGVTISCDGTDSNIPLILNAKGTSSVQILPTILEKTSGNLTIRGQNSLILQGTNATGTITISNTISYLSAGTFGIINGHNFNHNLSSSTAGVGLNLINIIPSINQQLAATGKISLINFENTITSAQGTFEFINVNPTIASYTGPRLSAYRSNIASATNRWQLYIEGTALNHINGNTGFGLTTNLNAWINIAGQTTKAQLNFAVNGVVSAPNDGDFWFESNTDTGVKIRINGVTKTFTVT